MAGGFKIAEAFVEVKADSTGLREDVRAKTEEASVGQEVKVKLKVDGTPALGGLMSNLAPFILPTVGAIGSLTGILGLVPAAAGAAGLAFGTLKVGINGFSDALKTGNTPAQLKAANEALSDLSPNARAAALTVRSLGPAWQSVQLDVQNRLFAGTSTLIRQVANADLPVLRGGMDAMAGSLNSLITDFGNWAKSTKTVADLKLIMSNSAIATQDFGRALQPILGMFRDVAAVGSSFLPGLASGFATAAQKAADFVGNARDTGKLADWIQKGIDATRTLFQVLGNLVEILIKVADAPGFGSVMLDALKLVTDGILWLVTNMPELVPIISTLIAAWKAWAIAQWLVNTAMDANPIGLLIVALAALGVGVYELIQHWQVAKDFLNACWQWMEDVSSAVWGSIRDFLSAVWRNIHDTFFGTLTSIRDFFAFIWNSIRDTAIGVWNNTAGFLTGSVSSFRGFWVGAWNGVVGDFQNIWGRIVGIAQNIWGSVTGAFRQGVNDVIGLINALVNGADDVLGFLHIALIPRVPALAAGGTVGSGFTTSGPMAIVGEGNPNHPEYVIPTDPAHRSAALGLYESLGAKLMAGGGIIDWIGSTVSKVEKWAGDGATGLMNSAVDGLAGGIPQPFHDIATSVGHSAVTAIKSLIDGAQAAAAAVGGAFSAPFTGSPNLGAWIQAALGLTGTPQSWAGPLSVLIGRESGGNPNAINLTDSNAAAGHPSQGLMQTIPGTFSAYHQPGTSFNITDPVANIAAGINYIKARYGSIFNVQQANPNASPQGYDSGGLLPTGLTLAHNTGSGPERVLNATQTAKLDRLLAGSGRTGGVTVNVTQLAASAAETGRYVALALRTVA